jgi:hypothetical protein
LLQQVCITGDWEAWLLFFVDAIAATANQVLNTAQQLTQLLERFQPDCEGSEAVSRVDGR